MAPTPSDGRALRIALAVWGASLALLALGGLLTGVWRVADLWGRAGEAFVGEFGLLATVGTFLMVGGPVYLWQRYGLVAPLLGLLGWVAYFASLGVTSGVGFSALYVAVMYGPLVVVGLGVLAALEWTLRSLRRTRGTFAVD